ncbi:MAG: VCBS repeat-containing protein [Dehalococcoidia bacterium]|nr:VCBS repeat-containing protein [Dehalococcoidia bacterium]
MILAAAGLLAVAFAACSDGSDVVIVAITRTPEAAATTTVDGVQSPGTPTAGTATPAPAPSRTVPPKPDNVFAGANLLVPYLVGGAADTNHCLPALTERWELDQSREIECATADLDGDGETEFVLRVALDESGPGDVWFFGSVVDGRRLLGSARSFAGSVLSDVRIVAVDDLTGDGLAEVVVSSENCGAATCTTGFLIMSGHRGGFENLAPEDIALEGAETPTVDDVTGDGLLDLVVQGGAVTSAGAGPPRQLERRLYWSGLRFFVVDQQQPARYLIHAIADADALFASADWAAAHERYLSIAVDQTLDDWRLQAGETPGRDELAAYAVFRAGLASLRAGDVAAAMAELERSFDEHPTSLLGVSAAVYLNGLQTGRTTTESCAATETFLRTRGALFARIWNYGYANPEHTIAGICR